MEVPIEDAGGRFFCNSDDSRAERMTPSFMAQKWKGSAILIRTAVDLVQPER